MTADHETKTSTTATERRPDERRWMRPLAATLAIAAALSLAGAIRPNPMPQPNTAAAVARHRGNDLSTPVKRASRVGQPDLSPELLYDLAPEADDPARAETAVTNITAPPPASIVALPSTMPALRGIYTGAAKARVVWLEVTAYCPCPKCCGPGAAGITASGKPVSYNGGAFCAADPAEFDFGVKLRIPGYHEGRPVEVIDRGGAIRHAKLDVYFPTHEEAEQWGRQWLAVAVEEVGSRQ